MTIRDAHEAAARSGESICSSCRHLRRDGEAFRCDRGASQSERVRKRLVVPMCPLWDECPPGWLPERHALAEKPKPTVAAQSKDYAGAAASGARYRGPGGAWTTR